MSSTTVPAVSVLMPVYNGQRYLAAAVKSILQQTFPDFELIAVDDGSADRSLQMLNEFAAGDARVRVIPIPHGGVGVALNAGLAAARGEFLARLDCDDMATPERLMLQLTYLRQHPDIAGVGSQALLIDEDGDPIGPMQGIELEPEKISEGIMRLAWPFVQGSAMFRMQALGDIGGYSTAFSPEDLDLHLRLTDRYRLANLPQTLLHYRRHPGSASIKSADQDKAIRCLKAACQRRGVPFIPPDNRFAPISESKPHALARPLRIMAWQALKAGYVPTARKWARRALFCCPWCKENWRLLACAIRGR